MGAEAGYQDIEKREEATGVPLQVGRRSGKRKVRDNHSPWDTLLDKVEQMKPRLLAEVECIIGIIKCQFGFTKFRYRGYKNATQIMIQSPPSISGRHYERCRKGRRR